MQRITLRGRVGSDGILQLQVPVGITDAELEVVVIIKTVPTERGEQGELQATTNLRKSLERLRGIILEQGDLSTEERLKALDHWEANLKREGR